MTHTLLPVRRWIDVCGAHQLEPDRGACVLVDGRQVALFRTSQNGAVHALSNFDPFSGTYVLSRGIVGSRGDVPKVASPMYKQSFDLRTGECLDDPTVRVDVFDVRCVEGRIELCSP